MIVTLKLATSLDGKIATSTGESQWITSPEARAAVHRLRADHDAVLVGVGTVLADNPRLNVRSENLVPEKQPSRVILDTHLRTPPNSRVFEETRGDVFILCGQSASEERGKALIDAGARILKIGTRPVGSICPKQAMSALKDVGLCKVFVEGGGQVATSFLQASLVDRLEWFRASIILGNDGLPALHGLGIERLTDALSLDRLKISEIGPDIWETYERKTK